jgi:hypothetical protein
MGHELETGAQRSAPASLGKMIGKKIPQKTFPK